MARLVFLDSKPLGMLANPGRNPDAARCRQRARELWADARRWGTPRAPPDALDGDAILAAQALTAAGPGDVVTVATDNVGDIGQFVDARPWDRIVP